MHNADQLLTRIRELEAENAALRRDAERYQWLKHAPDEREWLKLGNLLPDQLDAAIDAAMKGQK